MATSLLSAQKNTLETSTGKWKGSRPDGHATISIMADHTHSKGEMMFSYRFGDGNGNGRYKQRAAYKFAFTFIDVKWW
ncbi:hypothetical protein [Bizionia saleffrena]|uniref:hypothetical protein n=1 Tax=Bizionia saleffrena TaxID=291189 RepID=UPI001C03A156|nr:hypothetical protein [Bizionia saleffrena]